MDTNGYPWICIGIHGYLLVILHLQPEKNPGKTWLCMGIHGYPLLSTIVYDMIKLKKPFHIFDIDHKLKYVSTIPKFKTIIS